jgi:hypothetical protein
MAHIHLGEIITRHQSGDANIALRFRMDIVSNLRGAK